MCIPDLGTHMHSSVYYLLNTHLIGSGKYIVCMIELDVRENAN